MGGTADDVRVSVGGPLSFVCAARDTACIEYTVLATLILNKPLFLLHGSSNVKASRR